MALLHPVLAALADTALAEAIRESAVLFPAIETVHVIALALVAGTIAHVDLRLLGLAWRTTPVVDLVRRIVPLTLASFALAALSGLLLFASRAPAYAANPAFQIKLALLVLAGLNAAAFHAIPAGASPSHQRAAGLVSLATWSLVIVAGRWIGFSIR